MIKELEQTESTNTWAKEHVKELSHGDVVVTHRQTAGRGQRGNFWEAESEKNLTFSLLLKPESVDAAHQFTISEIVALAVVDAVRRCLAEAVGSERVKIKWPNDIYVDDRKIAGILIEHSLQGKNIAHTIAGIGLNVNQTTFLSEAPNPVSLAQLAHHEFCLPPILQDITASIIKEINTLGNFAAETIHLRFLAEMWRADGQPHTFSLPDGTHFEAVIEGVEPQGALLLHRPENEKPESFLFKEVAFVL